MIFEQEIINWYRKHKRNLPWRNTSNPYFIWLSEIILQQTRVEQGMPYYIKFTEKFTTIKSLANAPEEKVLKLWQGLGYYSRARNLHATAKIICTQHKGIFPKTHNELIKLKGIGPYTAAAISSFAYNEPQAVVDGNVFRVLARYFGIYTGIDTTDGKKQFSELAQSIINKKSPGEHNQAIMEFGSMQCKPVNPDCENCPVHNSCFAFAKKAVSELPVKTKKTKIRNRYFYYLVINHKRNFYIKQRTEKDIWKGLYDFPLIETTKKISPEKIVATKEFRKIIADNNFTILNISAECKHILSHQIITANFIKIETPNSLKQKIFIAVNNTSFLKYPIPRLVDLYFRNENKI